MAKTRTQLVPQLQAVGVEEVAQQEVEGVEKQLVLPRVLKPLQELAEEEEQRKQQNPNLLRANNRNLKEEWLLK
jgi:hypothetical protein